jgi:hypothetical protein
MEFEVSAKRDAVSYESFQHVIAALPKDLLPGQKGEGKIVLEQRSNGQS